MVRSCSAAVVTTTRPKPSSVQRRDSFPSPESTSGTRIIDAPRNRPASAAA